MNISEFRELRIGCRVKIMVDNPNSLDESKLNGLKGRIVSKKTDKLWGVLLEEYSLATEDNHLVNEDNVVYGSDEHLEVVE